jgi:hypothetical protein
MVRNLSREFATMTDEERRRFALERGGNADELDLDDPRDPDHMGRQYASPNEEVADPDARDGGAALLDDRAHERNVDKQEERRDG